MTHEHWIVAAGVALALSGCGGAAKGPPPPQAPDATQRADNPKHVDEGTAAAQVSQLMDACAQQEKVFDAVEQNVEVAVRITAPGSPERPDAKHDAKADAKHDAKKHEAKKPSSSGDENVALSETVRSVRAKQLAMVIKPVPEKEIDSKGVLQLDVDAFTASTKALPVSAWKDREGMNAATARWSMVSTALSRASLAVVQASIMTQAVNVRAMVAIAAMKKGRGAWGASWSAEDRTAAKRMLSDGQRSAMLGAIATALVAGYQGVIKDKQDPKALDVYAAKTLASFPVKIEVSDADVQAYVDAIDGPRVKESKARYEAMLRETYDDATYERKYKSDLDTAFAQFDADDSPKSGGRASKEPTSATGSSGSSGSSTSASTPAVGGKAGTVVKAASAAAHGDAAGTLEGAADLAPADSPVRHSLKGISALMKGDSKAALKEALSLAPIPGPAKEGITAVMGLFK